MSEKIEKEEKSTETNFPKDSKKSAQAVTKGDIKAPEDKRPDDKKTPGSTKEKEEKEKKKEIKKKKKVRKSVPYGRVYIQSSFNNTAITLTDEKGNVLTWATAGTMGYKGTRKSTPYAAGQAAKKIVEAAQTVAMDKVDVFVKGVGSGRETAVRALNSAGLNVVSMKDITPIPHNGPRSKKPRRV